MRSAESKKPALRIVFSRPMMRRLGSVVLIVIAVGAIALNVILFGRARQYYTEVNAVRLDPVGLNSFAAETGSSRRSDKPLIVFFGDSRAAGWPAPNIGRFEFVNRGIEAQTSAQAVLRFDAHVTPLRPRIVIVQVGINDLKTIPLFPDYADAIIAACKTNIREIVTRSTSLGAQVIVTTIFPIGDFPLERKVFWSPAIATAIDEVNAYLRSLAAPNVFVFDAYAILSNNVQLRTEYAQDELHLNADGYAALNRELEPVLATIR